MSRREQQPRKKRRDEDSSSSEDDDDSSRMPYFVPEDGIDIEPLAAYVRGLLDRKAVVRTGTRPGRREQKGFWVESVVAIGMEDIRAMIEDTKSWHRENYDGYYVNSQTMKRRLKAGRPKAAEARPIAPMRPQKSEDDPRSNRQASRASVEPDPRYIPPPPVARASADSVMTTQRAGSVAAPSPRPATVQPNQQQDPRRPSVNQQYSNPQQYANPGYVQATAQYTVQANIPAQYQQQFDTNMYDTSPPPYSTSGDTKRGGGGGGQPSTTGTQGFSSMYATSGGPSRAPNQGARRHDPR